MSDEQEFKVDQRHQCMAHFKYLDTWKQATEQKITKLELKLDDLNAWRSRTEARSEERDHWQNQRLLALEAKIDAVTQKLETLLLKPANNWDKSVWVLISTALASVATYAITTLLTHH